MSSLNLVRFSTLPPGDYRISTRTCAKAKLISPRPKGLVIQEVGIGMLPASGSSGRPKCLTFLAPTQKPQPPPRKTTCRAYIRMTVPPLTPPQVSSTRRTLRCAKKSTRYPCSRTSSGLLPHCKQYFLVYPRSLPPTQQFSSQAKLELARNWLPAPSIRGLIVLRELL